ncbi:MAG: phosphotransferase [Chloroflexi bacterium]|nr:phosphotransferase [Chloroflexota bacterium]
MTAINNPEWLPLVAENYGVKVQGVPLLLNEREGQRVFRVDTHEGNTLTVRLCSPERPYERVLADTAALLYLEEAGFPAPVLRQTQKGESIFQWQTGSWGYVHTFIKGENPEMDLPTLTELATLLGRLHTLAKSKETFSAQVDWLAELPTAIQRAESCANDPKWGTLAIEVAHTLQSLPDLKVLPCGLIHTDVHEGNLLRTPEGKLYLLDWEDTGQGEMIFDLALVLGWNCVWPISKNLNGEVNRYDFDEEWSLTFLKAYQQVRRLTQTEARLLGAAIRFVMGWFAARDIAREITEPGISEGLAYTNWAIMHSVSPYWEKLLTQWAIEA